MGEMATGLAYEIGQPLATILNYSRGALRRMEAGKLVSLDESVPVMEGRAGERVGRTARGMAGRTTGNAASDGS